MGEAKRRKLIDPEYGKRFDKFKKDDSSHRFKISLQSKVIDS